MDAGVSAGAAGGISGSGKPSEQALQQEFQTISQAFHRMMETMNNVMKTVHNMGMSASRLIR